MLRIFDMKRMTILWGAAWLLVFCAGPMYAQSIPIDTRVGKVSVAECAMTDYPQDTSAAILLLYEDHTVQIDYDLSLGIPMQMASRRERVKILKEEGKSVGDYSILLSRDSDDLESLPTINVVTYNLENGKVVATKMPQSNIFRTKYNDHYDKVSFTAQNVKVGSVIEARIEKYTAQFTDIDDYFFQRTYPINMCEYTVKLPTWLQFNAITRGDIHLDVAKEVETGVDLGTYIPVNTLNVSKYTAVDVPALGREPGLYCPRQYRSSMTIDVSGVRLPNAYRDFSVTWEDVDKQVRESPIMRQIKANCRFKDEVDAAVAGKTSAQDKLAAIIALVRGKVAWDQNYRLVPSDASEILRSRSGNSADINALVASAARYAGFTVSPVLISTRSNGMVLDIHPSTNVFNKLILCIDGEDGKPLYVDAADPDGWFNVLGDNDLVYKARVVPEKDGGRWADLTALTKNISYYTVNAELTSDALLTGDCSIRYIGSPSYDFKEAYRAADKEEDLISRLEKEYSVEVEDFGVEQVEDYGPQSAVNFHFEKVCDDAGGTIFVNPFLEKFHTETLFRAEKRRFPVEFPYPEQIFYTLRLTLPEGYTVDQVPERRRLSSGLPSSVMVGADVSDRVIQLTYRFDLGTLFCPAQDYAAAREYWTALCGIYEQMIVVKKP